MGNRTRKFSKLGQQLMDWRKAEGERLKLKGPLSRSEASRRIGISRQWLIEIECGEVQPTRQDLLVKIYRATGLKPGDWWEAA